MWGLISLLRRAGPSSWNKSLCMFTIDSALTNPYQLCGAGSEDLNAHVRIFFVFFISSSLWSSGLCRRKKDFLVSETCLSNSQDLLERLKSTERGCIFSDVTELSLSKFPRSGSRKSLVKVYALAIDIFLWSLVIKLVSSCMSFRFECGNTHCARSVSSNRTRAAQLLFGISCFLLRNSNYLRSTEPHWMTQASRSYRRTLVYFSFVRFHLAGCIFHVRFLPFSDSQIMQE